MYGKPAMTCFEYQVYLYCSETFTYLNAILYFEWLQSRHYDLSCSPTPHYRQPSPPLWQHYHSKYSIVFKYVTVSRPDRKVMADLPYIKIYCILLYCNNNQIFDRTIRFYQEYIAVEKVNKEIRNMNLLRKQIPMNQ